MAEKKPATSPTDADVSEFVRSIADERRRTDAAELIRLMTEVTGERARMWARASSGSATTNTDTKVDNEVTRR
jgi:hypothetical protein